MPRARISPPPSGVTSTAWPSASRVASRSSTSRRTSSRLASATSNSGSGAPPVAVPVIVSPGSMRRSRTTPSMGETSRVRDRSPLASCSAAPAAPRPRLRRPRASEPRPPAVASASCASRLTSRARAISTARSTPPLRPTSDGRSGSPCSLACRPARSSASATSRRARLDLGRRHRARLGAHALGDRLRRQARRRGARRRGGSPRRPRRPLRSRRVDRPRAPDRRGGPAPA